jgi:ankyrin repeat protein
MILSHDSVDVNQCDNYGNGPIHVASEKADGELMLSLLSKPGDRFDEEDFFGIPLYYAVYRQHVEGLRLLLERYKAAGQNLSIRARKKWSSNLETLRAEKLRVLLAKDISASFDSSGGEELSPGQDLLAVATANDNPVCFTLLNSQLNIWVNLAPNWKRKCLCMAAEFGENATLEHILELLRKEYCKL